MARWEGCSGKDWQLGVAAHPAGMRLQPNACLDIHCNCFDWSLFQDRRSDTRFAVAANELMHVRLELNRMRTVRCMIALLFAQYLIPISAFAEVSVSYVCKVEMSTGFKIVPSTNRWESVNFIPDDTYLVRPGDTSLTLSDGSSASSYEVVALGSQYPEFTCAAGFSFWYDNEGTASNWLHCSGVGEFSFNRDTLRFISTYTAGWTDSKANEPQKDGNTPNVSLGSCAQM